ncbi:MAG: hypothetical protein ABIF28_08795 [Pseudomonadota bacterium]
MKPGFLPLLLALCLFWQSLAFAGIGHSVAAPAGGDDHHGHAFLHLTEQAHHHHEDGIHFDDSSESVQHMQADGLIGTAGPLPSPCNFLATTPPLDPLPAVAASRVPEPFLEGLKRPPRPFS